MSKISDLIFELYQSVDPYTEPYNNGSERFQWSNGIVNIITIEEGIVTTESKHNLNIGDRIFIKDTSNADYNNSISNMYWEVVSVPSENTFVIEFASGNSSGGVLVKNCILTITGEKYTAERMLAIYKHARKLLLSALIKARTASISKYLNMLIKKKEIYFTDNTAPIKYECAYKILLTDEDSIPVPIISPEQAPMFVDREYDILYVVDYDNKLEVPQRFSNILDGKKMYLYFYGLNDYTAIDILTKDPEEEFHNSLEGILLTIANGYANEQANINENTVLAMLGGKDG